MKNILAILFILGAGLQTGYGQYVMTVSGPTSATAGEISYYAVNWTENGYPVTAPSGFYYAWLISNNGTFLTQGNIDATVNWTAVGSASSVYFEFETWDNFYYYYVYVTVTAAIPSAPATNAPSNVLSNSFTANWFGVLGATSYKLDVSTVSSFSSFVPGYNNLTVNATSQSVTGLSPGTTYYYRVRAVNSSGTSGNSTPPKERTYLACRTYC